MTAYHICKPVLRPFHMSTNSTPFVTKICPKFTSTMPCLGHAGSQGQGDNVINANVIWKCMSQGVCVPNTNTAPCTGK